MTAPSSKGRREVRYEQTGVFEFGLSVHIVPNLFPLSPVALLSHSRNPFAKRLSSEEVDTLDTAIDTALMIFMSRFHSCVFLCLTLALTFSLFSVLKTRIHTHTHTPHSPPLFLVPFDDCLFSILVIAFLFSVAWVTTTDKSCSIVCARNVIGFLINTSLGWGCCCLNVRNSGAWLTAGGKKGTSLCVYFRLMIYSIDTFSSGFSSSSWLVGWLVVCLLFVRADCLQR